MTVTFPVKEATLPTSAEPHDDRLLRCFCLLLLVVALLRCVDPSVFYLHEYLHVEKHLGTIDIIDHVWPMAAYTQLVVLIPIAFGRGRHIGYDTIIIVFGLVVRFVANAILMMAPAGHRWPQQVALALSGVGSACRAAFVSYASAVLPVHIFLQMTSYKRMVNLMGYMGGGAVAFGLKRAGACWPTFFWVAQGALALTLVVFLGSLRIGCGGYGLADDRAESRITLRSVRGLAVVAARSPAVLAASAWYQLTLATFEVVVANASSLLFLADPEADSHGLVLALGRLMSAVATAGFGVRLQGLSLGPTYALVGSAISAALVAALSHCRSSVGAYISITGLAVVLEPGFCTTLITIANSVPSDLRRTAIFVNVLGSLLVQALVQGAGQIGDVTPSTLMLALSALLSLSSLIMAIHLMRHLSSSSKSGCWLAFVR